MKKYVSVLIAVILLFAFASCNKDGEDSTTQALPSVETTTAPVVAVTQPTTEAENPTYILTTEYGQTMPTVITTAFNLVNEAATAIATTQPTTSPDLSFTVPSMSAPEVVSEVISTTAPSNNTSQNSSGDVEGDNSTEEVETKPADQRERKNLEFNSSSFDSSGNLELCFELAGWNGIKAGKVSGITVSYEGNTQTVEGYVKQGSDGGIVTVYTKSLNIPSDTVVNCTIPAGVVVSKNNNQYNMSYSFSISTGTDAADYE